MWLLAGTSTVWPKRPFRKVCCCSFRGQTRAAFMMRAVWKQSCTLNPATCVCQGSHECGTICRSQNNSFSLRVWLACLVFFANASRLACAFAWAWQADEPAIIILRNQRLTASRHVLWHRLGPVIGFVIQAVPTGRLDQTQVLQV